MTFWGRQNCSPPRAPINNATPLRFDSSPVYRTSYAVRSAITTTAELLVYILIVQVRDDVTAAESLVVRHEAAVDDVTGHVTMTSRRLRDVTERAHSVSTSVQEQLGDSVLEDIAAVRHQNTSHLLAP